MAHVVSLVYTPRDIPDRKPQGSFARVGAQMVNLAEFHGIDGDAKGGAGDRQLNVMLAETLAELQTEGFRTEPGALGEQIVIAGLAPEAFTKGTQLRVGRAVIVVGILRTGCARLEMIQGKPRELSRGRLGVLAQVVQAGAVRVGDPVEVVESLVSG